MRARFSVLSDAVALSFSDVSLNMRKAPHVCGRDIALLTLSAGSGGLSDTAGFRPVERLEEVNL